MKAATFVIVTAWGSCVEAGMEGFFWFVLLMMIISGPIRWIAEFQGGET